MRVVDGGRRGEVGGDYRGNGRAVIVAAHCNRDVEGVVVRRRGAASQAMRRGTGLGCRGVGATATGDRIRWPQDTEAFEALLRVVHRERMCDSFWNAGACTLEVPFGTGTKSADAQTL